MIRTLMLALLTVLILLIAGAAGLYFMLGKDEVKTDIAKLEKNFIKPPAPPAPDQIGYYPLPEMMAVLTPRDPQHHIVLMQITLRLRSDNDSVYIQNSVPKIIDAIQCYIRDDGLSNGPILVDRARFKTTMLQRLPAIVAPGRIDDLLFKELSIQ